MAGEGIIKTLSPEEREQNIKKDEVFFLLRQIADDIEAILREYLDLREDYYKLITIWIIGCYIHNSFSTYPYLFFNAMRGSGKSRTLKLISALGDGELLISLREAVLFRYPRNKLLVIDEFEGVSSKENGGLREILNASYKKGMSVMRAKRIKMPLGDDYVLEKFEPFKPIAMANIWGMEEVLADRSITLILEKSSNPQFNMLVEDFDRRSQIIDIKVRLKAILVQLCSYCGVGGVLEEWNKWVKSTYHHPTTLNTFTTLNTLITLEENTENLYPKTQEILDREIFFESIARTEINGRNLELFLPLILIAKALGDEWVGKVLEIASTMIKERKVEELTQSKDVAVYDFVSKIIDGGFVPVKELTWKFREFIAVDSDEDNWVNSRWFGRALIRLNLVKEKRRLKNGIEVILNHEKAREKLRMFKEK